MRKLMILAMAAFFVVAMTLPAMAQDKAEWAFYGSVRMWTGWEKDSSDTNRIATNPAAAASLAAGTQRTAAWTSGTNLLDDGDLIWAQQNNSRIGARVKAGNIGGRFEYGHGAPALGAEGSGTGADATFVRLLFGTWNFGPGTLLIGQDYTPIFYPISAMCGPSGGDCSGIGYGTPYSGRKDQIKLMFGGLSIALIEPQVTVTGLPAVNDLDRSLPKFEVAYQGAFGPVGFYVGGGWNTVDAVYANGLNGEKEFSVDSYTLGAAVKAAFGPFYINGAFQWAQNPGNYGLATNINGTTALLDQATAIAAGGLHDTDYWCGMLVAGFKVNDMLSFEMGYSHQEASVDDYIANNNRTFDYETDAWFVMATISPTKNFYIIPEIGVCDFNDEEYPGRADRDLGKMTWYGVKWQIDF